MSTKREHDESSLWLSVQNAASELEVTTRTIYRFINDGKLTAYRIGRVYRIRRADLDAFLVGATLQPGDLDHLVDDTKGPRGANHDSDTDDNAVNHVESAPVGPMRTSE